MSGRRVRVPPRDLDPKRIHLPPDEVDRVLAALTVYANIEEYDKGNREKAKSIRSTARGIALQVIQDAED